MSFRGKKKVAKEFSPTVFDPLSLRVHEAENRYELSEADLLPISALLASSGEQRWWAHEGHPQAGARPVGRRGPDRDRPIGRLVHRRGPRVRRRHAVHGRVGARLRATGTFEKCFLEIKMTHL